MDYNNINKMLEERQKVIDFIKNTDQISMFTGLRDFAVYMVKDFDLNKGNEIDKSLMGCYCEIYITMTKIIDVFAGSKNKEIEKNKELSRSCEKIRPIILKDVKKSNEIYEKRLKCLLDKTNATKYN